MVQFPNCKINLGLHITSKRPDGYHNIETIMVPVGWTDVIEIVERDAQVVDKDLLTGSYLSEKVNFYSYGNPIPGKAENNLCIKVYHLLEDWFNLPAVDIHLIKNVPIGAGLGGGSSDAAFCLKTLKDFFSLTISDHEAKTLLAKIGSDCPFFWDNQTAFAFGKGDEMRHIDIDVKDKWIMLVYPNIAIGTAEAYSGVKPKAPKVDLELLPDLPIESWREVIENDFELSVFPQYPEIGIIKDQLYTMGAQYASLSGSGSTMYAIFEEEPELPSTWKKFPHWIGQLA